MIFRYMRWPGYAVLCALAALVVGIAALDDRDFARTPQPPCEVRNHMGCAKRCDLESTHAACRPWQEAMRGWIFDQ
jgi:hypothetical protein